MSAPQRDLAATSGAIPAQRIAPADTPPDSGAKHRRAHRGDWILLAWCVLLTVVMLGPLAAPGYVLSYDMVAVPDQALLPSSVGLSSAVPRAVPLDAAVAILDTVLTGQVLQKLALAGIVLGAALGAGLALPKVRTGMRLVAASVYAWNAYVFERLVIGHWPTLIAYAALPWLLILGRRVRRGSTSALAPGLLLVGVSSLTPTGGLLAAALFGALVIVPGGRHGRAVRVTSTAAVLALQAPWVVPSVLRPDPAVSDPSGVAAFAGASDSPLGLVGSLLTLGGIWNEGAVPDSRALPSALALTAVVLVLAVLGATELRRHLGRAELVTTGALAASGLVVAVSSALPGGDAVLEWLVSEVPGGGLIRDGQKFLAWYALLVALAAAAGAARLARSAASRNTAVAVMLAAAVLPIAALPDLAWGAGGRLEPSRYPAEWSDVRATLRAADAADGTGTGTGTGTGDADADAADGDADPDAHADAHADADADTADGTGDVVVLPYQPFRRFPWAGDRTVLDPAPRYLGVEAVVPDALPVGGTVVPGEDRRAAEVAEALDAGPGASERLAALGVGWIAVERDTPGTIPDGLLESLESVEINGTLDLYRVPGAIGTWARIPPAPPVIAVDIIFSVIIVVASADVARNAFSRRRRSLRSQAL